MLSTLLALLWGLGVNAAALAIGHEVQGRVALAFVALGIPILGLITWQHGPWAGFLISAAGVAMLRWPLLGFGRRLRRARQRDIG